MSSTTTASSARQAWEAENGVLAMDPKQNALYEYDAEAQKRINESRPWAKNPHFFTDCRVSALALVKMATHARSGGDQEIMGLMTGYVSGTSIVVTDAFRLPVEGTETRVNAQSEANEYIINYTTASREGGGRPENPVGWYHSHPGYGCWLSGIDVATQLMQQTHFDPFVAVVIDPNMTVSAGKVEIGAFRTFPEGYTGNGNSSKANNQNGAGQDRGATDSEYYDGGHDDDDGYQPIPASKMEDFGAHANSYYGLRVSHFKSSLDSQLLSLLWNKYWVGTLSQSSLHTNRDYIDTQISDHAIKIRDVARRHKASAGGTTTVSAGGNNNNNNNNNNSGSSDGIPTTTTATTGVGGGGGGGAPPRNALVGLSAGQLRMCRDQKMEALVRAGKRIAAEETAGLTAARMKETLFWGVFDEVRQPDEVDEAVRDRQGEGEGETSAGVAVAKR